MVGQKICRTCAKKENPASLLTFLFGQEADQLDLRGKIKKYTPIELNENDNLPKSICCECKKTIVDWHEFFERCSKIDNELKINSSVPVENMCFMEDSLPLLSQNKQKSEEVIPNSSAKRIEHSKELSHNKPNKGFYCIAKWCNNNNTTRRMFRLPKDKRCHVWLTRAHRNDLKDLSMQKLHNKYLCEDHFTDDMYASANKKSLIWNALPSIFPVRYPDPLPSSKGTLNDLVTNTYGKRYRPLMIKEPEVAKQFAPSQPSTSVPVNSAVRLLGLPQSQQKPNKIQHVLLLNADQKRIYLERSRNKQICKPQEKLVDGIIVNNKLAEVPKISEDGGHIERKNEPDSNNMLQANTTLSCNRDFLHNENNCGVGENMLEVAGAVFAKDSLNEDITNCNLERDIDDNKDIENGPVAEFIKINEGASFCLNNSAFESTSDADKITSEQKNFNSFGTPVVDSIENFKVGDVDSLCSSQFFKECMNTCFACGEVFLMKSSLAQHCKTYHGEKFDDVNSADLSADPPE